jgi:hypothetical protein
VLHQAPRLQCEDKIQGRKEGSEALPHNRITCTGKSPSKYHRTYHNRVLPTLKARVSSSSSGQRMSSSMISSSVAVDFSRHDHGLSGEAGRGAQTRAQTAVGQQPCPQIKVGTQDDNAP